MKQYDVCAARAGPGGRSAELVVVLQHDFLSEVGTRAVASLVPEGQMRRVTRLHPMLTIDGKRMIIAVDRLAAVPTGSLGAVVATARSSRAEITAALDLLFTGF